MVYTTSNRVRDLALRPVSLARLGLLIFGVAACGEMLGLWDVHARVTALPQFCLVHRLTGHGCPGCGMGRALALLASGDPLGSVRQHPFALPFLVAMAAWGLLAKPFRGRVRRGSVSGRHLLPGTAAVCLIVWWLVTKVM